MSKKQCKYFNTPKGCNRGDRCRFLHSKDSIEYDEVKEFEESILLDQCSMGLDWSVLAREICLILIGLIPSGPLALICLYTSIEKVERVPWISVRSDPGQIPTYNGYITDECENCFHRDYDIWFIINPVINITSTIYRFRQICRSCLPFEFDFRKNGFHLRGPKGEDPIWVSRKFKPQVCWKDEPIISINSDSITPVNNIAKLKFACINESSRVIPWNLFTIMIESKNTLGQYELDTFMKNGI